MLRFSENRRSSGLSVTTNPRTAMSTHGLVEATQSEAEGGTVTGRYMSPLRTAQAFLTYSGAALTKTDDTNITLTLGGTPATAVLKATSITVGWTGTLAASRGGTGLSSLGSGVATWLGTPSSANLAAAMTDKTGTGVLVFGTSPGFTTAANPVSNGGAALGTTALGWSGAFLATGAGINYNNGNMTENHAANSLTFAASGKSILQLAQNPAGDVGGTYLKLWPGNAAGFQNIEFDVISSQTAAGASFRMWSDWPFVIHAPSDQSASAKIALYESEANGTNRMVWQAASSIATDFTLVWPNAVPAVNDTPLVCSTGGVLTFGSNTSITGSAQILSGTGIPAGGTAGSGLKVSSTSNFGYFHGSGAPSLAAAKGSLYLRSDGSGVNDRMYVNTNGSTTWTAVVTVA